MDRKIYKWAQVFQTLSHYRVNDEREDLQMGTGVSVDVPESVCPVERPHSVSCNRPRAARSRTFFSSVRLVGAQTPESPEPPACPEPEPSRADSGCGGTLSVPGLIRVDRETRKGR